MNGQAKWTFKDGVYTVTFAPVEDGQPIDVLYPYMSQWDTTDQTIQFGGKLYKANANRARGDCGPAALASIIWMHTHHRPNVNEAGIACGQPASRPGSMYTGHGQLRAGAAHYGLTLETHSPYVLPQFDMDLICAKLAENKPLIALIKYGALAEELAKYPDEIQNQDEFEGTHWVTVVACNHEHIFVMDPNFWGDRRADGNYRSIPTDAFVEAMRRVPESPWCSVPYQGLALA